MGRNKLSLKIRNIPEGIPQLRQKFFLLFSFVVALRTLSAEGVKTGSCREGQGVSQ